MGICRYCQQPTGFFRHKHAECKQKADVNYEAVATMLANFSSSSQHFDDLSNEINRLLSEGSLTHIERIGAVFSGLKRYVAASTEISLPAPATASKMFDFITDQDLRAHSGIIYTPVLEKVEQIKMLAHLGKGELAVIAETPNPFLNISTRETQIWSKAQVKLYEDRVHSHRVTHGHGATIRVARGVYVHAGSGRSHVVSNETHDHVDTGQVAITNKAIYFVGKAKSFKILLSQIVSIRPCHHGVEIMRGRGKSEYLVTGDEWFVCNLISTAMHK